MRQPQDAQVRAGPEQHHDQDGREAREAQEGLPPQRGLERPDHEGELHEAADPERGRAEVQPVGELREPRRACVRGRVAREREAGGEPEREQERRPEQPLAVGQPGQEDERRHERVAERHRHERVAEARLRKRREVAVEEVDERELERVLGPQQEREDPDLERADHADSEQPVEAALGRLAERPAHDQQPEAEAAREQRERQEVEPADEVLARRRARRHRRPRSPAAAAPARRRCRRPRRRARQRRRRATGPCSRRAAAVRPARRSSACPRSSRVWPETSRPFAL